MNLPTIIVAACLLTNPKPVRVGVADFPPMISVDAKTGAVSGSDFEMFELLVTDPDIDWSQVDYDYVVLNSFSQLMNSVENGEVDLALNGISITHDRLQDMNFSQPYMHSGQLIMVPPKKEQTSVWSYMSKFMRLEILYSLCAFIANCFFWGAVIYFVERALARAEDKEQPNIQTLEQGTLAAFDAGTTIGYGRFFPITRLGNFIAVAAFFCGTIVVADVISTLTTEKIVNRLEGEINGPDDLKGKKVAVVAGTTSNQLIDEYNPLVVTPCDDFYKAVVELRLGNVDAVLADDPTIRNYIKEHPDHGDIAGNTFHPEDYGIAFSNKVDVDLVKKFSIAIARLREGGKLALIEKHWYGD